MFIVNPLTVGHSSFIFIALSSFVTMTISVDCIEAASFITYLNNEFGIKAAPYSNKCMINEIRAGIYYTYTMLLALADKGLSSTVFEYFGIATKPISSVGNRDLTSKLFLRKVCRTFDPILLV
jgi:hypothetical protein